MENKNITTNLLIKQMIETDAMAYNRDYLASSTDSVFLTKPIKIKASYMQN